ERLTRSEGSNLRFGVEGEVVGPGDVLVACAGQEVIHLDGAPGARPTRNVPHLPVRRFEVQGTAGRHVGLPDDGHLVGALELKVRPADELRARLISSAGRAFVKRN